MQDWHAYGIAPPPASTASTTELEHTSLRLLLLILPSYAH